MVEKEMATHSSVLVWRIPGTGEPSGLPSKGSHRVGHDWSDLAAVAGQWSCNSKMEHNTLLRQTMFWVPSEQGAWQKWSWVVLGGTAFHISISGHGPCPATPQQVSDSSQAHLQAAVLLDQFWSWIVLELTRCGWDLGHTAGEIK